MLLFHVLIQIWAGLPSDPSCSPSRRCCWPCQWRRPMWCIWHLCQHVADVASVKLVLSYLWCIRSKDPVRPGQAYTVRLVLPLSAHLGSSGFELSQRCPNSRIEHSTWNCLLFFYSFLKKLNAPKLQIGSNLGKDTNFMNAWVPRKTTETSKSSEGQGLRNWQILDSVLGGGGGASLT